MGDLFQIEVGTPKWLMFNQQSEVCIFGKGKIFVFHFDFQRLSAALNNKVASIEGKSWEEIATQLSSIAIWEFDNYKQ